VEGRTSLNSENWSHFEPFLRYLPDFSISSANGERMLGNYPQQIA